MFFVKIVIGWIVYFVLHSILAATVVKEKCKTLFPALYPYYRIFYNLIAIAGIILLSYWSLKDTNFLLQQTQLTKVFGLFFLLLSVIMLGIAFASFNKKEFLGLEAEIHNPEVKLVTTGIYKYIRHPLYTGTLLMFPGIFLYKPTLSILLFIIIATIYIEIGSRLEEIKLIEVFGADYIQYKKSVKRYFPFIY